MDWNKIKEEAGKLKDKAAEKTKPLLEKASEKTKPYLEKAADWGYENASKVPVVLKNGEDYEKVRLEKVLVIFVLEKDEEFSKKVMMEFPLVLSKAWIVSATTRIIRSEETPELVALLDKPAKPSILIYKKGVLFRKIEKREELDIFLKDFDVFALPLWNEGNTEVTPEKDPLSSL